MAALTSAISILEVQTAYLIDQKNWSRKKATLLFGSIVTVIGMFCSLSLGGGINITGIFGESFFLGATFFDVMDNLSSKYMLPIGGMMTAVFILVKWKIPEYMKELKTGADGFNLPANLIKSGLAFASLVVAFIILNEIFPFF